MQHATWLKIESSPFLHRMYRRYRLLPEGARRPLRVLSAPRWHLATLLVRQAAGHRAVAGPFRGMQFELSPLSGRHRSNRRPSNRNRPSVVPTHR